MESGYNSEKKTTPNGTIYSNWNSYECALHSTQIPIIIIQANFFFMQFTFGDLIRSQLVELIIHSSKIDRPYKNTVKIWKLHCVQSREKRAQQQRQQQIARVKEDNVMESWLDLASLLYIGCCCCCCCRTHFSLYAVPFGSVSIRWLRFDWGFSSTI